ncbi:MAG TPA: hypothetical protein VJU86_16500 [Pyrinomonadaceae bacterium]|nr:hypothetical protein [Pyrinomonadaceae bacterium]
MKSTTRVLKWLCITFICLTQPNVHADAVRSQQSQVPTNRSKIDWSFLQQRAKKLDGLRLEIDSVKLKAVPKGAHITAFLQGRKSSPPWISGKDIWLLIFRNTHSQYKKVLPLHRGKIITLKYTPADQDPSWYKNWDINVPAEAMDDIAATKFLRIVVN